MGRDTLPAMPANPPQPPSIGHIVHYVSRGSADGVFPSTCRAAIITEVDPGYGAGSAVLGTDRIGLSVINPTGLFFHSLADGGAKYDTGEAFDSGTTRYPGPGTWHWPERV